MNAFSQYIALEKKISPLATTVSSVLRAHGLSSSQYAVLRHLYLTGPQNQTLISKATYRSNGNTVMVVQNLRAKLLVKVSDGKQDRRANSVELTAKGVALCKKVEAAFSMKPKSTDKPKK